MCTLDIYIDGGRCLSIRSIFMFLYIDKWPLLISLMGFLLTGLSKVVRQH